MLTAWRGCLYTVRYDLPHDKPHHRANAFAICFCNVTMKSRLNRSDRQRKKEKEAIKIAGPVCKSTLVGRLGYTINL